MAGHSQTVFVRPETLYLVWQTGWAVGGAGLLWLARAALRRPTDGRVGWSASPVAVIAFFCIYFLSFLTNAGIAAALAREAARFAPETKGFMEAVFMMVNPALMAFVLLLLRRYTPEFSPGRPHRVKPAGVFGFTFSGILRGFAAAMCLVFVSSLIWGGMLALMKSAGWGDFTQKQHMVLLLANSRDPIIIVPFLLGAVVFAPVHEELFYRAGVFSLARNYLKSGTACAICGLIFGLVHGNVAGFLPLAVLGAWLAWLYDTTADLRVPIVIHAAFNLSTVVWLVLAPNSVNL